MSVNLRRQTARICCVITTCLLFMQFAVAAYACPGLGASSLPSAAVVTAPSDMVNGCEVLDPANPNLCLQHWQAGSQLPDAAAIAVPLSSLVAMAEIALPDVDATLSSFTAAAGDLRARDTAPAINVRNCCLRI